MKIVIVGLGTGGLYASKAATIANRSAKVVLVERREYDMFSPCGLPYAIEGVVKSFDELKYSVPDTRRLRKLLGHKAIGLDTDYRTLRIRRLDTGREIDLKYDSLIIASGSRPTVSSIPGAEGLLGCGVHIVSTIEDSKALKEAALKSERAVVVGGGATGLETSVALRELGLEVVMTEMVETPLHRSLDSDMGGMIIEHLKSKGVKTLFGEMTERVNGGDRVESVTVDGRDIPTDLVVVAIGNRPETGFLKDAGLETRRGAIVTDDRMKTSAEDVYAVGDCALTRFFIDKEPIKIELSTSAMEQGLVAGENAAGGDMRYEGTLGTFATYIGGWEVSATGYNSRIAEERGCRAISAKSKIDNKPGYMPDAKRITVKLVVDGDSGRVLGAQAIGREGAAWRVNVAALAIKRGMNIEDFSTIELAYCPPISDLYDPLHAVADVALRRFHG